MIMTDSSAQGTTTTTTWQPVAGLNERYYLSTQLEDES